MNERLNSLSGARKWWRPIFAFVAISCILAIVVTICFLLWTGGADLSQASGVIMAIITALATPLTVLIGGRSYEKIQGSELGISDMRHPNNADEFYTETSSYNPRDAPSWGKE